MSEFADYHLKALVADKRLKINKNGRNLFTKRDIELKKPELLQKLDAQKQAEANTKSAKMNCNGDFLSL